MEGLAWFLAGVAVTYVVVKRATLPLPAPAKAAADQVAAGAERARVALWGDAPAGVDKLDLSAGAAHEKMAALPSGDCGCGGAA